MIINEKIFLFKKIRKIKELEKLMNVELYIKEDFSEFRKVYEDINKDNLISNESYKKSNILKEKNNESDDEESSDLEDDYDYLKDKYQKIYEQGKEAFQKAKEESDYKKMISIRKKIPKHAKI